MNVDVEDEIEWVVLDEDEDVKVKALAVETSRATAAVFKKVLMLNYYWKLINEVIAVVQYRASMEWNGVAGWLRGRSIDERDLLKRQ